ncbi:MAG TPA: hypothetical protein VIE90_04255 [Candidatus Binatia bacterium]|jgi:hypothetical protein
MSTWETIFSQSPVNKGYYNEEGLPQAHWEWPKRTWFQSRLDLIRGNDRPRPLKTSRKLEESGPMREM